MAESLDEVEENESASRASSKKRRLSQGRTFDFGSQLRDVKSQDQVNEL